ncbi:hypothetical protein [Leptospira kemamanensis]|uniref:hypothetical protein n=1 Tax=Leptospira kemamanensis TaxID=2484942 RepID=UPI001FCA20B5|nr:hypothetical protein [Leptospira kemamanensis]
MNPKPFSKRMLEQIQVQGLFHCKAFIIFGICIVFFVNCFSSEKTNKSKEPEIQIHFLSKDFEETKSIPSSLLDRKDLLFLLAELSKKEDPSMRFISTNRTEEIMEVNGIRNSWDAGWVVYVNGERMDGMQLKRGVKVGPNDQIRIRFETVERVFGRPIN